jgi:hypothetical protein
MIRNYKLLEIDPNSNIFAGKYSSNSTLKNIEINKIPNISFDEDNLRYNIAIFEDKINNITNNFKRIIRLIEIDKQNIFLKGEYEQGGARNVTFIKNKNKQIKRKLYDLKLYDKIINQLKNEKFDEENKFDSDSELNSSYLLNSDSDSDSDSDIKSESINNSDLDIQSESDQSSQSEADSDDLDKFSKREYSNIPLAENPIINLLFENSNLINISNTFFNGKIKRFIIKLTQVDRENILLSIKLLRDEFNNLYLPDYFIYLNFCLDNPKTILDEIKIKIDRLTADVNSSVVGQQEIIKLKGGRRKNKL